MVDRLGCEVGLHLPLGHRRVIHQQLIEAELLAQVVELLVALEGELHVLQAGGVARLADIGVDGVGSAISKRRKIVQDGRSISGAAALKEAVGTLGDGLLVLGAVLGSLVEGGLGGVKLGLGLLLGQLGLIGLGLGVLKGLFGLGRSALCSFEGLYLGVVLGLGGVQVILGGLGGGVRLLGLRSRRRSGLLGGSQGACGCVRLVLCGLLGSLCRGESAIGLGQRGLLGVIVGLGGVDLGLSCGALLGCRLVGLGLLERLLGGRQLSGGIFRVLLGRGRSLFGVGNFCRASRKGIVGRGGTLLGSCLVLCGLAEA